MSLKKDIFKLIAGGNVCQQRPGGIENVYQRLVEERNEEILQRKYVTFGFEHPLSTENLREISREVDAKMEQLEAEGKLNIEILQMANGIYVSYREIISYEEWLTRRSAPDVANVNNGWANKVKHISKRRLGIDSRHGGVRLIYVKLFLEDKITEQDFKDLILGKDVDFADQIMELVPEGTEGENVYVDYIVHPEFQDGGDDEEMVFINNLG